MNLKKKGAAPTTQEEVGVSLPRRWCRSISAKPNCSLGRTPLPPGSPAFETFTQNGIILLRKTTMRLPLSLILAAWLLPLLTRLPAATVDLPALQARAQAESLHEDPVWRRLLHFEPGVPASVVDDPTFFLHPEGRTRPDLELAATLEALVAPPTGSTNEIKHAVCRFVARYHWLRDKLQIDPATLPVPECDIYLKVRAALAPSAATVAFADGHINSPASMFGHTLLVFDSDQHGRFLSKAVNYAADTRTRSGCVFAVRGIFGGYKGRFSVLPYYEKLEQYSDISKRDIWEYQLQLAPDELERLFAHTWEMQNKFSWYYFFTRNCSYHLLHLLNAARPDLDLTSGFDLHTLPLETVRRLHQRGLVGDIAYRPSKATRFEHLSDQLLPADRRLAKQVAETSASPWDVTNRVANVDRARQVLDLAAALQKNRYAEQKLSPAEYRKRHVETLRARSRLGRGKNRNEVPQPTQPNLGHSPARGAVGFGIYDDRTYAEARWRLTYHGLLDPPDGFPDGAHIVFGEAAVRINDEGDVRLHEATAIDILSLAPWGDLFKPLSWSFHFGFRPVPATENLALNTAYTRGISLGIGESASLGQAYLLAGVQARSDFDTSNGFGVTAQTGWTSHLSRQWRQHLWLRNDQHLLGDEESFLEAGLEHRVHFDGFSLGLVFRHEQNDDHDVQDVRLEWLRHF